MIYTRDASKVAGSKARGEGREPGRGVVKGEREVW
jgi:hypothetical protein